MALGKEVRLHAGRLDTLTPRQRSELMSRIRAKDTKPEMSVRRLVHGMGYRYRLHVRELPGQPDLVFRPRRKVIFVHGCFWHRHNGCSRNRIPTTRRDYWSKKLNSNVERDRRNEAALREMGWRVLVIWECETRDQGVVRAFLLAHLRRYEVASVGNDRSELANRWEDSNRTNPNLP